MGWVLQDQKNVLGRSNSKCKGPEAGPCPGSGRLGTLRRIVWPEPVERMVGDVVREVGAEGPQGRTDPHEDFGLHSE